MRLRLLHDNVLVRLEADADHGIDPDLRDSPIYTPEAVRYHACRGTVAGVGPGRWVRKMGRLTEYRLRPEVRKGDRVEIGPSVGQQVFIEGAEYRICPESELQVVLG